MIDISSMHMLPSTTVLQGNLRRKNFLAYLDTGEAISPPPVPKISSAHLRLQMHGIGVLEQVCMLRYGVKSVQPHVEDVHCCLPSPL